MTLRPASRRLSRWEGLGTGLDNTYVRIDWSSDHAGFSCDEKQPCPDDDDPDGSRDALAGRCDTFDGDGGRHDSHRASVHDAQDEEDCRQTGTAGSAVESETQAVSPGGACVGRQRTAAPRCLPTAGQLTRLPRGELEGAG